MTELDELRVFEGRGDLCAEDECKSLDSLEVRVLDGHHSGLREHLLGEVVDQLAADEDVAVVLDDLVDLDSRIDGIASVREKSGSGKHEQAK